MHRARWFVLAAIALGLAFGAIYQLGVPLRSTYGARVNVDEPFYLLTTVSLLQDGDLDLANDFSEKRYAAFFDQPELWQQSVPTPDGRVLSPHNVGLPVLLLPAYATGGVDGAKAFLGVLGGATVGAAALLAHRATGRPWPALLAAALLGATAPFFVYATQIYPELPAALLVTLSAWLILAPQPGKRHALGLAACAIALAWLGVKYAILDAVLVTLMLGRVTWSTRATLLGILGVSAIIYAWFHLLTYGALTPYSVNRLYAGDTLVDLVGEHVATWDRLYRLLGLWIDVDFGLVRWAPILLLVLPALLPVWAPRGPARWTWTTLVFTQLMVAVFLSVTMRGWWFPGRMLIVVLPLLAVPLAATLASAARQPLLASLTLVLAAYSIGITASFVLAARAGEIALAVDPFNLAWLPFRALAGVFPRYEEYTPATWLLSAVWLVVGGLLVLAPRARLPAHAARLRPLGRFLSTPR